jgi:hypothetical protein
MKFKEESIESISMNMHTALRKLCDSKATSALWNAINIVSDETTTYFFTKMQKELTGKEFEDKESAYKFIARLWMHMLDASHDDFEYNYEWKEQDFNMSEFHLLSCIGGCMSKDDWLGMCAYMEFDE